MLILSSTSDIVRIVTDASGDIEVHASWADNNAGTITPGRTNTASITTATTTTVVGSPASSQQRNVRHLNITNNHASQTVVVTVEHTDGTNAETLMKVTLLAGENLVFDQGGGWTHYDPNGGTYGGLPAATQADMESGTSLNTFVTPGRLHFHPAAAKFWIKATPGGTINASYNVSAEADSTAGVCDITIGNDFSSANYAVVAMSLRANTNTTVTDAKNTAIRSATQAAGAVSIETYDQTATNFAVEDPTSWYAVGFGDL
jgi:hypothetical protein